MQIKVKIISGEGPTETYEFESMKDLLDFAWSRTNLGMTFSSSTASPTYTVSDTSSSSGTVTVHNSTPLPKKRGIIARILGK